jgi:nucleoside-specific outer membrane channel protein Tsx
MLATTMLAAGAVVAVSALAFAEETIIEKHTYESQKNTVEVAPAPEVQHKVVERTVTTEQPAVQKRTDTVVTTHEKKHDDDED